MPLKSSAHAGLANPTVNPAATTAAVSPRLMVMMPFRAVASILYGAWVLRSTTTTSRQTRRQLCACSSCFTVANQQTRRIGRAGGAAWSRVRHLPCCASGYPSASIARLIDYRPGGRRPTSAPRWRKQLFSTSFSTAQPIASGHREQS
jgi:hypothetical protein